MKNYWTESAVGDLKGIKEYIARDSEYYAINYTDRINLPWNNSHHCPKWEEKFLKLMKTTSVK